MTMHTSWLERTIRRDELIVGAGLLVVAALSWVYLLRMAAAMDTAASEAAMHAAMGMTMAGDSMAASELLSLWVMWTVMMAAMMLPSAAPVALVVLGAYRRRGGAGAVLSSYAFVLGYLLAWTAFSLVAAAGQLWLRQAALLSPEMASTSRVLPASCSPAPASTSGCRSRARVCRTAGRRSTSSCATGAKAGRARWRWARATACSASAAAGP
jgi:predicted metal-binding membrane protein